MRGLDVDEDLLAALPPDAASWIRRSNVQGKIDVDGLITAPLAAAAAAPNTPETQKKDSDLDLALNITLRDATLRPENGQDRMSAVVGLDSTLSRDSTIAHAFRNVKLASTNSSEGTNAAEFVIECQ